MTTPTKEIVLKGLGGQGCKATISRRGANSVDPGSVYVGWTTEAGHGGPYLELDEVRCLLRDMKRLKAEAK